MSAPPGWWEVPGPHRVALGDLARRVAPPRGYVSLEAMAAELAADPGEGRVVADLAAQWARDGRFRRPLRVEDGELTNGCHRFAASWRGSGAGAPVDVWVCVGGSPPEPAPHAGDRVVEVRFVVVDAGGLGADALEDLVFSVGRSLPVGEDRWAEADGGSCVAGVWSFGYYDDGFDPEELSGLLAARLGACGVAVEVASAALERL